MKFEDLSGCKFGRLTVIQKDAKSKGRTKWICKCDCGNVKSIQATHLKSGATSSCGCYQKERAILCNTIHGKTTTSLHNRWKAIKQRCLNSNNKRYQDYGERGINICDEWLDFRNFEKWALNNGYAENLSLDRVDNDKGYSPDNCRWTDEITQNRNRRDVVYIKDIDRKIKLKIVSEITGISFATLYDRITKQNKKSLKEILSEEQYMLITNQSNKKLFEGLETR